MRTYRQTKSAAVTGTRRSYFNLFDIFNIGLMIALAIAVLYPFWQTAILSFSNADEATSLGIHLWPERWSLEAYKFLFSYEDVMQAYVNTISRTVAGTAIVVLFTVMAAFPLSKSDLPYRNWFTIYFLVPMFFSGGLIPTYLLIKQLGLLDNRLVLILPGAVSIFSVIIMRNYFMTIDKGFEESALIDGANYFTTLTRIILPISKPVIATIALWAAVGHWNAWFDAMIYIRDPDKTVMQLVLRQMLEAVNTSAMDLSQSAANTNEKLVLSNVRAAAVLISIGPIVLIYPYLQKYFIKGITLGSLKG